MKIAIKFEIEPNEVEEVYIGKAESCSCGCAGDYFKQGEEEFLGVIDRLNKNFDKVELFDGGDNLIIFEMVDQDEEDYYQEQFCVRAYVNTEGLKYKTLVKLLELKKEQESNRLNA